MRRTLVALILAVVAATVVVLHRGSADASDSTSATARIDSLASPSGPGAAEPNLVLAPDGRVLMSWLEPVDSSYALRFARLDGERWSAPTTIRSGRDFFVNWADFPSMEVLAPDVLAAHWLQRTGKGTYAYGVRVAVSRDGGRTWNAAITPHRDTSNTEHGFVAMWREGDRLGAVWLDGRKFSKEGHHASNEMMLASTTIGYDGSLGAENILDERTCDCCQNSAAMTTNGPIVAYRDRSPDEIRDVHVTRRVNGKWTAGVPVHSDNWTIPACPVNGPSIAARGRMVAVAWFTAANDSPRVKLAFSNDAGATFGAPVRVDEGNPAGRVDVELLDDGDALVTWIERTGGDVAAVRARRVRRDGRAGRVATVATSSAARASGFPRSVVTGRHVVFAWTVPGKPSAIRVARAEASDFR